MEFGNLAVVILLLHLHTSAYADGSCADAICGEGTCKPSNKAFLGMFNRYTCECNPGWTKFANDDTFPYLDFLPCVIPNCTVDYSCSNQATSAPSPPPIPTDGSSSFLDPCTLAICGDGECVKASSFSVSCSCNPGSTNLLNNQNFPCFRKCSLGADCDELGINFPTQSSPPSTTRSANNGSPGPSASVANSGQEKLMWVLVMWLIL